MRGDQELQLRCFCRKVLLDPWISQPQCQFWLMQLLKPWPMVSQARLLFIFYGPLTPEGEAAFWCSVKLFLLLLAFSRLRLTLNKNVAIGILAVKRNLRNRAHLNATKSLWWQTDRQTVSEWVGLPLFVQVLLVGRMLWTEDSQFKLCVTWPGLFSCCFVREITKSGRPTRCWRSWRSL